MNEFQAYEYTVRQKQDASLIAKRICLIISYVLVAVGFLLAGVTTRVFVPLLALLPISLWIFVHFTWRYVDVENEISVVSGILTISKIYGRKTRKTIFEVPIKTFVAISQYDDNADEKIRRFAPEICYEAISSDSANNYFALFETEDEKKAIFIFELAGEYGKILKIFKFYNSAAFTR